jgi:hypothetical protein
MSRCQQCRVERPAHKMDCRDPSSEADGLRVLLARVEGQRDAARAWARRWKRHARRLRHAFAERGAQVFLGRLVMRRERDDARAEIERLRGVIVDRWHADAGDARPLHEALGMTWAEYSAWVEQREVRDAG